jgi:hypothetical protein
MFLCMLRCALFDWWCLFMRHFSNKLVSVALVGVMSVGCGMPVAMSCVPSVAYAETVAVSPSVGNQSGIGTIDITVVSDGSLRQVDDGVRDDTSPSANGKSGSSYFPAGNMQKTASVLSAPTASKTSPSSLAKTGDITAYWTILMFALAGVLFACSGATWRRDQMPGLSA